MYRRRWLPSSGRFSRQIGASLGLLALAVTVTSLPVPAADAARDGLRVVLVTDYDVARALRTLARLAEPAKESASDPQPQGRTIPVTATPARGLSTSVPSFLRPLPPGGVLSWFGWRVGADGGQEYHPGVDLGAPRGALVRAAAEGVVKTVSNDPSGYGLYVVIDHGDGWETLYAHNDRLLVTTGQQVRQGQAIARVGRTGNATAPHVHLEVRLAGSPIDPAPYLGLVRD